MSVIAAPELPPAKRLPKKVLHPSLYEINTRVLLRSLQGNSSHGKTLDDIPESMLDNWANKGFDWIWMLGVWQTGPIGQRLSRTHADFLSEFRHFLPNLSDADICGSSFAVAGYSVSDHLGGNAALSRLRKRLADRNLNLMLDFVPNHTALDHPWVAEHPEYYIAGTEDDLAREPQNYCRLESGIFAYGRDPYFPGWPDTLQLNYADPRMQQALRTELLSISERCDGVRCDMAMLMLPDVFERTWHRQAQPFWPGAIEAVKARNADFRFLAEVYWDREWDLQQQGFDYTYDKRLYDRLHAQSATPVRDHLKADHAFQIRSARFLENHDEPRAAAVFPDEVHKAAAVVSFFVPGLRFFHQGQFEGFTVRIPVHVDRGPAEPTNAGIAGFYQRLLQSLTNDACRTGEWSLLDCAPAWDGNWTSDSFICSAWSSAGNLRMIVAANYSPHQSQCFVRLPFEDLRGRSVELRDVLGDAVYDRSSDDLLNRGLYLDLPPWGRHVFEIKDTPR